jgi:hypothetical protein
MILKKQLLFYMVCMFEDKLCILIHQYLLGIFCVIVKKVSISVLLNKIQNNVIYVRPCFVTPLECNLR